MPASIQLQLVLALQWAGELEAAVGDAQLAGRFKVQAVLLSRKVREELRTRKDVYAYDLLAWALHKQGRHQEASSAMQLALRMGTKDPQLVRHAEAIERALGPSAAGQP